MFLGKPFYIILCLGLIFGGFLIGNSLFSLLVPQDSNLKPQEAVTLESVLPTATLQPALITDTFPSQASIANETKASIENKRVIPPVFVLKGIIYGQDNNVALVNNRIVKIGDTILGAKVVDITESTVELVFEDQKITLRINQ